MMRRVAQNLDLLLLGATLLLILYSVTMIYSATYLSGERGQNLWDTLFVRQAIHALVGIGLMFLVARIDYQYLELLHRPLYILVILSLLLVFVVGHGSFGAQRWLDFNIFTFQPSELAKLIVIITLAKYLADRGPEVKRFPYLLLSLVIVAIPMLLIYLQPALGTALILAVVWLAMVLVAGARLRHLTILALLGVLCAPLIWLSLEDYMRERVMVFLNPQQDPLGAGYNMRQALIAVGSGGWIGQGLGSGSQSQLHFLRVRPTDFIFSVLAEELGFLGVLILFTLLGIILFRILRAADLARDDFGKLIACGVASVIATQAFVNIGMNIGLIPAVGMPLPFMSYGGSGLITFLVAEGVVQSVLIRHRKLEFQ